MKFSGLKKLFYTTFTGLMLGAITASAAPANDNFAARTTITGTSITGSNVGATREGTDPARIDFNAETTATGTNTIWYRWTAPTTGQYTINTAGSSFDTQLYISTGATAPGTKVASNEDAPTGGPVSAVTFAATAGTVYNIMVSGYDEDGGGNAQGNVTINIIEPGTGGGFTLTTGANGNGSVSASPAPGTGGQYAPNTSVTLTATPATGATFTGWSGDATGTVNPLTVTMNSDKNITANFTGGGGGTGPVNDAFANAVVITGTTPVSGTTVGATRENGETTTVTYGTSTTPAGINSVWYRWVAPSSGTATFMVTFTGTQWDSQLTVVQGAIGNAIVSNEDDPNRAQGNATVSFTAVQGTTYHIRVTGYDNSSGTFTLTPSMGGGGTVNRYSLTLVTNGNGRITRSLNPGPDGDYASNATVTLTAIANSGAGFAGWSGDTATINGTTATVVMRADRTVTANFTNTVAPVEVVLTLVTNPVAGGTVTASPVAGPDGHPGHYTQGTTVTLTANPNSGFEFVNYTEGGIARGTSPTLQVVMTGNRTVTANFRTSTSTNPPTYSITRISNPVNGGSITLNPNLAQYDSNATVTATATPNSGFAFTRWEGNPAGNPTSPSITFPVRNNISLTAVFTSTNGTGTNTFVIVTSVSPTGGGTISRDPSQPTYDRNSQVSLTATPAQGFTFTRWQGTETSTANPLNLTVTADENITAVFTAVSSSNNILDVVIQGQGTVTPNYDGRALVIGRSYTMTAIPARNSLFSHWITPSGNVNTARLNFTMVEGLQLTAVFEPNRFVPVRGTYYGLVYSDDHGTDHSNLGHFRIAVNDRGAYSGTMQLGGRNYSVRGQLGPDGTGPLAVRRSATQTVNGTLSLNLDPQGNSLTGSLNGIPLSGHRQSYNGSTTLAPQAGTYYVFFPGGDDETSPSTGDGYGRVTVDGRGNVRVNGVMADGSTFSQGTLISRDGRWPFYAPLNGGKGLVVGWLTFENTATSSLDGTVHWVHPATTGGVVREAFHQTINAIGSLFITPRRGVPIVNWTGGAGVGELGGDNVTNPIIVNLNMTGNSVISVTGNNGSLVRFAVSPAGNLTGSFRHPINSRNTLVRGGTFQRQNALGGFFLGIDSSGFAFLDDADNTVVNVPESLSGRTLTITSASGTGSFSLFSANNLAFTDSGYSGGSNFGPGTYNYAANDGVEAGEERTDVAEINMVGSIRGRPAVIRTLLFFTSSTGGYFLSQVTAGGSGTSSGQFSLGAP